jgi:hypothetical protein
MLVLMCQPKYLCDILFPQGLDQQRIEQITEKLGLKPSNMSESDKSIIGEADGVFVAFNADENTFTLGPNTAAQGVLYFAEVALPIHAKTLSDLAIEGNPEEAMLQRIQSMAGRVKNLSRPITKDELDELGFEADEAARQAPPECDGQFALV